MQTIAIVNEKGGTGKTTTAVNLSAALGEMQRKVLLVDLDGQAASSRWLGVEEDTSFADALWRGEGLCPVPDVVPGVSLAPGSGKLDSVAHDLRPTQGGQLRKLLSQAEGFDYVLIDCPPSLGNRLIGNALLAATHAVVPVETSILALDGLKILLTTLEDVCDGFEHDIELLGVLACRFDARTKLSKFILEELKRALPGRVFETVIRENVRVRECPASGQSVLTYAPDSHAAEDYRALAREVAAKLGQPFDPVTAEGSPGAEQPQQGRPGVSDIRRNVDAMLRELTPKAEDAPPAPEPAPTEAPTTDEPAASPAPAQVEPPAAVEPWAVDGPAQPADPAPEPEGAVAGPAPDDQADQPARSDQAEQATTETPTTDEPAASDTPAQVEPPAAADGQAVETWDLNDTGGQDVAADGAETQDAPSETSDQTEQQPQPASQAPPDEGEQIPAGEVAEEVSPAEAEQPLEEPAEKEQDFPALRAMLRDMSDKAAPPEADGADEYAHAGQSGPGSQRIFRK